MVGQRCCVCHVWTAVVCLSWLDMSCYVWTAVDISVVFVMFGQRCCVCHGWTAVLCAAVHASCLSRCDIVSVCVCACVCVRV